jgi:AAA domain
MSERPADPPRQTRIVRIEGVDVEILSTDANRFNCVEHGATVMAFLNPAGVWKVSSKCECTFKGRPTPMLQPFLDAIVAAGSNGAHSSATNEEPKREPGDPELQALLSWQYAIAHRVREKCDQWLREGGAAASLLRTDTLEAFIATVDEERNRDSATADPADLTPVEIAEQIEKIATEFQKQYAAPLPALANGHTPATRNGTALPAVSDDYTDRMAIDAYDAYRAMIGEKREYSMEGLIRDGCTAVLSALIGAGKSTFAMNLARAWALGVPFLGRECRQSKTLVVVSPKEFEAWADTIGFWELKGLIYLVESTKAHFRKQDDVVRWFDYQMKTFDCRTFVLDTLFDFFGMPPNNTGDANRIAMNEQTPLLQLVRERNYSGLVTGHAPKSEAKAIDPRDPEESFGGHTAWTAQHRMRMTIRRKSQGVNAFITGRGGYGDKGILKEELLSFDEHTRLDSLGGLFSDHLGEAAMPSVIDTMRDFGGPISMPKLIEQMGKSEKWARAGVKAGRKGDRPLIETDAIKGKKNAKYWLRGQNPDDPTLL